MNRSLSITVGILSVGIIVLLFVKSFGLIGDRRVGEQQRQAMANTTPREQTPLLRRPPIYENVPQRFTWNGIEKSATYDPPPSTYNLANNHCIDLDQAAGTWQITYVNDTGVALHSRNPNKLIETENYQAVEPPEIRLSIMPRLEPSRWRYGNLDWYRRAIEEGIFTIDQSASDKSFLTLKTRKDVDLARAVSFELSAVCNSQPPNQPDQILSPRYGGCFFQFKDLEVSISWRNLTSVNLSKITDLARSQTKSLSCESNVQ